MQPHLCFSQINSIVCPSNQKCNLLVDDPIVVYDDGELVGITSDNFQPWTPRGNGGSYCSYTEELVADLESATEIVQCVPLVHLVGGGEEQPVNVNLWSEWRPDLHQPNHNQRLSIDTWAFLGQCQDQVEIPSGRHQSCDFKP